MDDLNATLQAEIARKKAVLQRAAEAQKSDKAKIIRRTDLEVAERQQDQNQVSEMEGKAKTEISPENSAAANSAPQEELKEKPENSIASMMPMSPSRKRTRPDQDEVERYKSTIPGESEFRRRFRLLGEPVLLFGEEADDRWTRLKKVEAEQHTEAPNHEQQDVFRRVKTKIDQELQAQCELRNHDDEIGGGECSISSPRKSKTTDANSSESKKDQVIAKYEPQLHEISLSLVQSNPKRCATLMYVFLKKLLFEWEETLEVRTDDEKHAEQGKLDFVLLKQSAENLKPLFKSLKMNSLEPDVLARLAEICHAVHRQEYVQANDAYLRLSIGNAPWPIGVTMVGIHERKAHERIATSVVAHVLNDEVQRKWIQAIKRLMTQRQKRSPNPDPSRNVG